MNARKFKVGDKVVAKVSRWSGTVVKVDAYQHSSSPYTVRWDRNGATGKHNDMTIERTRQ